MIQKITPEEMLIAKKSKKELKESIKELESAVKLITKFKDAIITQKPDKATLKNQYSGRLLRFKRKIFETLNIFLKHINAILILMNKITDPDMDRLKNVLLAEINELSDGTENFSTSVEQLTAQIQKRLHSISEVVDNQIYHHIDTDILGRSRIGSVKISIRQGAQYGI